MRLSYSTVKNLVENCAWQTALQKIVGIQRDDENPRSVSGTAFHAAVELHERYRIDGQESDPEPTVDALIEKAEQVVRDEDTGWPHAMLEGSLDEALLAVTHWWAAPLPKNQPGAGGSLRDRVMQWKPLMVEEKLTIELPSGREWTGIIDAVYQTEDGIVPVDQKSAKDFRRYPLTGKGNGLQSATYVDLLAAVHDWDVARFEFHVARVTHSDSARFERSRVVQITPNEQDRQELALSLRKAEAVIDSGLFPKTPDSFLCSSTWCPMHVEAGGPCDPQGPFEYVLPQVA